MSELTIMLIALAAFAGGCVLGYILGLSSGSKDKDWL